MADGNIAAMREALLRCEAISHLPEISEQQCVRDMRNIIAHALAAPARNCDVGTAEEQAERYGRYRDQFVYGGLNCERCPCFWAQLPDEEGVK